MRVGIAGLVAAVVVGAGLSAGITYAIVGGDETARELEQAFDDAERSMNEAAEDFAESPGYDRDAVRQGAFETEAEFMPDHIVLGLCDAAAADGAAGVEEYMHSESYVFELPDDMVFTAQAWVDYCGA